MERCNRTGSTRPKCLRSKTTPCRLRLGVIHGSYCVGCCFGLFVILFAVGVMSLFRMAVIAAVIFIEKTLPFGERASRALAVAFIVLGVLVAVDPTAAPDLTESGSMS
jgi:predicted metal-binding membrane protein